MRWSIVGSCRSTSTSRSAANSDGEMTGKDSPKGKEVKAAVSSLRADTVAAAGLDISKKCVALPDVCVGGGESLVQWFIGP